MLESTGRCTSRPTTFEDLHMGKNHWMAVLAAAGLGIGGATLAAAQAPPPPPHHGAAQAPGADARGDRPGMRGGMRHGRGHMGGGPLAGRMAAELGLTDDQKQRVRALRESAAPGGREVMERMRDSRRKLDGMSPEDPAWSASVDEASRIAAEAATRRVREGARMRAELWKILTPEQRTKLAALEAQREQRMRDRMDERRQRMQKG
jgi:Spy/CpxP family protein refolding chaperone